MSITHNAYAKGVIAHCASLAKILSSVDEIDFSDAQCVTDIELLILRIIFSKYFRYRPSEA